ncbi:MAG: hypothetical protein COU82_02105 [Candidatus Portnoybacteria bacterium CG10_big_fil_rev_8_21_14_0_10_38_18]|uniref:DUF1648 domain-containing protein n=1 Tax=Candidatus Portnoybacteria bacterium CG10_big_fil_rev_8_21_14_0_10_38_18 TaxID=1974813 RepID=A0A2M8KBX3_9BACT|nr:MAG: hypothetical protein COU82_02105 [Candidatus Portnoybacteria bacterium CG10_big_fil_rev_8_21_14_0_10_38_18]
MKKSSIFILIIILISFAVGIYFYPQFPDKVASHWNARGEVDGYMSKFWGLFLMPIITLGLWLMFILIPKIDPLKKNIEKFRKYFDAFIVFIILFLFYIYVLTIFWNLGKTFDMGRAMVPAIGILFFYIGILLKYAKRNWFIGIRTPWTLSSDNVWDKTHKLGAKLFKIAAIITLLGLFFPKIAIWLAILPAILFAIYTFIYSYIVYKKEEK